MSDIKKCNKCGKVKPLREFSIDKGTKDGYQKKCKLCDHEYYIRNKEKITARNAKYYAEHHEERMAYHAKYRAEHREEIKASCERYARKYPEAKRISTAKYNATHREAVRARNAKYAAENPEKLKRMKLNYQNSERGRNAHIASEHRRRMNGASPLETDLIEELKEEYGGFCPYCNKWINNGHIDHIFPISRSGTNERNNLVFVCAPCNLNKSNKNLLEFMIFRRLSTEVQNATI